MLKALSVILIFSFLFLAVMLRHHPGTRDTHSYNEHSNQWLENNSELKNKKY
jgi:hypothetical protein